MHDSRNYGDSRQHGNTSILKMTTQDAKPKGSAGPAKRSFSSLEAVEELNSLNTSTGDLRGRIGRFEFVHICSPRSYPFLLPTLRDLGVGGLSNSANS